MNGIKSPLRLIFSRPGARRRVALKTAQEEALRIHAEKLACLRTLCEQKGIDYKKAVKVLPILEKLVPELAGLGSETHNRDFIKPFKMFVDVAIHLKTTPILRVAVERAGYKIRVFRFHMERSPGLWNCIRMEPEKFVSLDEFMKSAESAQGA